VTAATVVLVPGMRGTVEDHWQTRLAATLPHARCVPPLGRTEPGLRTRVTLLDRIVDDVDGPVVLVAHSAGALVAVHWAAGHRGTAVRGALLATQALARAWGSRWHSLGAVGHLNPSSGFGDWPEAAELIRYLAVGDVQAAPDAAPLHRLQPEST
jgi:uncharacterized protein